MYADLVINLENNFSEFIQRILEPVSNHFKIKVLFILSLFI